MFPEISFSTDRVEFRKKFHERRPLLQTSAFAPEAYSWVQLDQALSHVPVNPSAFKIFLDGPVMFEHFAWVHREVDVERFVIDSRKFADLMRSRATVVLNRFETSCPLTQDVCFQIARYAGAPAVANAYFSIGGLGTFGHHWDRHDVFAVQLVGRKRWRLYKPTIELPMSSQRSSDHRESCPTVPVMDVVLEAGSILYVPRGWWHSADSIDDEQTLHLAVGLHPPLVQDYVEWVTQNYLPTRVEARRSIKMYEGDNCPGVDALEIVASLLSDQLANADNLKRFQEHIRDQQRFVSPPSMEAVVNAQAMIDKEAVIAVNAFRPIDPVAQVVVINGCELDVDAATASFLAGLQRRGRSTLGKTCAELPLESRVKTEKLVATLAAQGVLQVLPSRPRSVEQRAG